MMLYDWCEILFECMAVLTVSYTQMLQLVSYTQAETPILLSVSHEHEYTFTSQVIVTFILFSSVKRATALRLCTAGAEKWNAKIILFHGTLQ